MTEPRDEDETPEPTIEEKEAAETPAEPVEGAEGLPTDVKDGTVEDDEGEP